MIRRLGADDVDSGDSVSSDETKQRRTKRTTAVCVALKHLPCRGFETQLLK